MNITVRKSYFSAAISADSMHSQYDVPHLVGLARVPREFPLVNLDELERSETSG